MKDLSPDMEAEELLDALRVRAFEVNLIVRALSLIGVRVQVDLVERYNPAHSDSYTEIIIGEGL